MSKSKKLILVTGASKGFGQSIALTWAPLCSSGSKIILTARSEAGLTSTESGIKALNPSVNVVKFITDHGRPLADEYEALFQREVCGERFDDGLLVHNVGIVEPQGDPVSSYSNLREMEDYFRLNLFSLMMLNSTFLRARDHISSPLRIVNVSSAGALDPIPSWGYYCIGKASRLMYFRTLAAEEPDCRVLNYSPGVMNTSAVDRIKSSHKTSQNINDFCTENVLEPRTSAARLETILAKDTFESGAQIDFSDEF